MREPLPQHKRLHPGCSAGAYAFWCSSKQPSGTTPTGVRQSAEIYRPCQKVRARSLRGTFDTLLL